MIRLTRRGSGGSPAPQETTLTATICATPGLHHRVRLTATQCSRCQRHGRRSTNPASSRREAGQASVKQHLGPSAPSCQRLAHSPRSSVKHQSSKWLGSLRRGDARADAQRQAFTPPHQNHNHSLERMIWSLISSKWSPMIQAISPRQGVLLWRRRRTSISLASKGISNIVPS